MSDFEQWAENDDYAMNLSIERDEDGRYRDIHIENMLRGWNAAIASMQGEAEPYQTWRPIDCAPKDGTILRLLVYFTDNSLEDDDSSPIETIGHNSFDNTGEDEWQFAGWNWCHDVYTQGIGVVKSWMPMSVYPPSAAAKIAEQDARIKELEQQLEVARKDAERWQAICNLWFSCSELKLIQKEDGGYSICEMEFVDNLLVSDFCGDTPEHTIDAAIRQIGGAE